MENLALIAQVQSYTAIALGLIIGAGLIDAAFLIGVALAMFFAFANPLLARFG